MPTFASRRRRSLFPTARRFAQQALAILFIVSAGTLFAAIGRAEETPDETVPPPLSPAEGLASISVPDGLRAELVAAEPLVFDPVAFDWGTDGELWIVEMADYPRGDGGRVVRLTDDDGDGGYDTRGVFLDGVPFVNGVMAWRKGVLVSAAPEIFYAEDANGDGVCDVRRTLFRGFSQANPQHLMNGFVWGLDGWLHAGGEESEIEVAIGDGNEKASIRGDFRLDPDHLRIEQESGRTQFGRARNDWNDWFGSTNSDPGFQVLFELRYLARNPHLIAPSSQLPISEAPGASRVYPTSPTLARFNDLNKANRFTSACSLSIYRDDLLGERYRGNSFVAEPVHNLVHREVLSEENGRWSSRRAEEEAASEFFRSSDPWCRPVATKTGPDGALCIADMYRLVIEHPQWIPDEREAKFDLHAGSDRGRIYRVVPVDRPLRAIPRTKNASAGELVALLESPNGQARDMAHLALYWRGEKDVAEAVAKIASAGPSPAARVQALSLLSNLDALDKETLIAAHRDADAEVRRFAVRVAEPKLKTSKVLQTAVAEAADDPSVRVRLQAALSLGEMREGTAGPALARIVVRDGADPYLRAAAFSSATNDLSGFCAELVRRIDEAPSAAVTEALALTAAAGDESSAALLLTATFAGEDDAERRSRTMERLIEFDAALRRRSSSLGKYRDEATGDLARALAAVDRIVEAARSTLANEDESIAARSVALRLLATTGDRQDQEPVARQLAADVPSDLQTAAVDALFDAFAESAPSLAIERWRTLSPRAQTAVIDRLASNGAGRIALLEAISEKKLPPTAIDAARRQALLGDEDEQVRALAASVLGRPSDEERGLVVERYRASLATESDASRGEKLFEKHCATCHRIGERGHAVGPDLAALSDRSPEAMLTAIFDPNRAVETKFVGYLALGTDGRTHQGLLVSDSGAAVELLAAEGKRVTLLASEIETLKNSGVSMMPVGFEKDLSPQDAVDVIAYVRQIRPERKTFAGNEPRVVEPEGLRGEFWLLPKDAELYGPTLTYREATNDLVDWRSDADMAAWTIAVEQPGRYRLSVEYARAATTGGAVATVEIDGQPHTLELSSTGGDDSFAERGVADVELPAGERRVSLRASASGDEAIWRPQTVRLRPIR